MQRVHKRGPSNDAADTFAGKLGWLLIDTALEVVKFDIVQLGRRIFATSCCNVLLMSGRAIFPMNFLAQRLQFSINKPAG